MLSISSQKPHISTVLTNTITYKNKTKRDGLTADLSLPGMAGQPRLSFGLFGLASLCVIVTVVYFEKGYPVNSLKLLAIFLHGPLEGWAPLSPALAVSYI